MRDLPEWPKRAWLKAPESSSVTSEAATGARLATLSEGREVQGKGSVKAGREGGSSGEPGPALGTQRG